GSTAQAERSKSVRNVGHGFTTVGIGQYGRDLASTIAAAVTVAASKTWQIPKAVRGETRERATYDPAALPIPKPARKTARMIEKAYTMAPSIRERRRVQPTSASSAHSPDSAITS